MIPQQISDAVTSYCRENLPADFKILSYDPLSGGCINNVNRVRTNKGDFCIKYNSSSRFPGMFEAEAKGLGILKSADSIRVPGPFHTGEAGGYSFILLEYIPSGKRSSPFFKDFGRSLARLHRHTEDYYGLDHDNYIGSLHQNNKKHDSWSSFFIEERISKQAELARNGALLESNHILLLEKLYLKLDDLIPGEPPSLLHGDLWSGNYMVDEKGNACLIDPAVYYGHRETDLAMTKLFGGFDEVFYESYDSEYPLEKGWKERIPLNQLYPLLVHLNLFGKSYLSSVLEIIEKYY